MKFTLKEWNDIKHALKVAADEYRKIRDDCKPSDDEHSLYRIYDRQVNDAERLIDAIENNKF